MGKESECWSLPVPAFGREVRPHAYRHSTASPPDHPLPTPHCLQPRCQYCGPQAINSWIEEISQHLKRIAPNHLVTTGEEGKTGDSRDRLQQPLQLPAWDALWHSSTLGFLHLSQPCWQHLLCCAQSSTEAPAYLYQHALSSSDKVSAWQPQSQPSSKHIPPSLPRERRFPFPSLPCCRFLRSERPHVQLQPLRGRQGQVGQLHGAGLPH